MSEQEQLKQAGVIFEPDALWAEYGHLGDGHSLQYVKITEVIDALDDAREAVIDGMHETLDDALHSLVSESAPEVEVCSNNEWLRVYGGYEPKEDTGNDEIDEDAFAGDCANMEAAFAEADFVGPRSNRGMCHHWNGAHFTHRTHGHGTFDQLTTAGAKLWDSI